MFPEVNPLGLKILFLLIPGIIALGIVKSIGPKKPRSNFDSGLQIFIYGVSCYALVGFFENIVKFEKKQHLWTLSFGYAVQSSLRLATLNSQNGLGAEQIALATGAAIAVGIFVSKLQSHSIPHTILRKLSLTKRTNEVDIWELTLNSPDLDSWVTVRHHSNGKVYQGWIRGYSDGGDERELLLVDVKIYANDNSGNNELIEVDSVPVIYLGLDRKNAVLELCKVNQQNGVDKDE